MHSLIAAPLQLKFQLPTMSSMVKDTKQDLVPWREKCGRAYLGTGEGLRCVWDCYNIFCAQS